jgi:hypothetical protein
MIEGAYARTTTVTLLAGVRRNNMRRIDVLRGQISVGMFLSPRRRWETVWAVYRQFMIPGVCWALWWAYRRAPPSVRFISNKFVVPIFRETYWHRVAHAHCLPHEELRALAHGHHARGLHRQHASRLHRKGPGSFEHNGGIRVFAIGVESRELAYSCRRASIVTGTQTGARGTSRLCQFGSAHSPSLPSPQRRRRRPPAIARRTTPETTRQTTANMSDNDNGENGDELVTKPFKFVTGRFPATPHTQNR